MKDVLPELSARLGRHMAELVRDLAGAEPTQRGRTEWRWRAKGSLAVEVDGPRRGIWHDHQAGEGGDPLALIAHLRRVPLREATSWARGWLGEDAAHRDAPKRLERPQRAPEPPREPPATLDAARRIWRECVTAEGTLAEIYLAGRELRLEPGAPLRFHSACPREAERLPALVALMSDPVTGEPCGIHRTYLAAEGRDRLRDAKGRAMLGGAGVVRMAPDAEVTLGLGIAEGVETCLAVLQGFDWRPVWAATSAGAIARFPVLAGIEALTIFADADKAGTEAAQRCAARWAEAGREARILTPPRGDFNDLARETG
jgi:hypothetical protein